MEFIKDNKDVDVFGGPDQSAPNISKFERSVGYVLTSPLATASTRYRHQANQQNNRMEGNEKNLILCNMWFKAKLFTKQGYSFDEKLFRNEENVLINQLKSAKKNIVYFANLFVYHKRKDHLGMLAKTVFKSGECRFLSFFIYPKMVNLIYFVPVFFVLAVLLLPFYSLKAWSLLLLVYVINIHFASLRIATHNKAINCYFNIFFLHMVINFSYGIGFLSVILKLKHIKKLINQRVQNNKSSGV